MKDIVHQKVDVVDLPEYSYYDKATNLAAHMGERDVDMIQLMLECNQALRDGESRPKLHLRRERNLAPLSFKLEDINWLVCCKN